MSLHIGAEKGQIAKTVLMPGDPLRAKFIAENFLDNPVRYSEIRNVYGYTGTYKGVPISVQASGMGMPSMGIYSHELFNVFDVQNIMRIGSAGAINKDVKMRDIVIAQAVCTDSNWVGQYHLPGSFSPIASFEMLEKCVSSCKEIGAPYHVGNLLSSDRFYGDDDGIPEVFQAKKAWAKMGVMAIEMESAALYMNAARYGKNALAVCTVSDHLLTGEALSADERQSSFTQMMEVALETARKMEK